MKFQEGYAYHIKDDYFIKVKDDKLMQNKENGRYRPTFLCLKDEKTGLLWMVPMSTQVEKYQIIHGKQVKKYGKCLTIVIGEFDSRHTAFLLQNMFPITEYYLDHIHTRNGNPVQVKHSLYQKVKSYMQQLRQIINRGKNVVFPNVSRLEKLMIEEIENTEHSKVKHTLVDINRKIEKYKEENKCKLDAESKNKNHNHDIDR